MQILVNGLIDGLGISLLALAFALVYLPTNVFHVALAGVYTLAPFVTLACLQLELGWHIAVPTALAAGAILSLSCEFLNHRRLARRDAPAEAHLLSSLGLLVLIGQGVAIAWGTEPKVLRVGVDAVWTLGPVVVTRAQVVGASAAMFLLTATLLVLWRTASGLRLRGLADNPTEMQLRGHRVDRLRIAAFAGSGFLAAATAQSRAYDLGFSAHGGMNVLLVAVVAVIVGGRRSFLGPVLAGLLLGVARAATVWLLSARWETPVTFLLLLTFLLLRPQGLLAREQRLESAYG